MNVTTSVFKRPTRDKKTKRLNADGKPQMATAKGGWVYRIRYVEDSGRPKTIERGPFTLKNEARAARDNMLRDLEKRTVSQIKTSLQNVRRLIARRISGDAHFHGFISRPSERVGGPTAKKNVIRSLTDVYGFECRHT